MDNIGRYSIQRHGGNSNHSWRTIFTGDEDQCRFRFGFEKGKLRQGVVALVDKDGRTIDQVRAPRLRSKW